jgi:hypothetical protein
MWKPVWVQKEIDRSADRAANPISWRQLIALGAAVFLIFFLGKGDWWASGWMFVVMIFVGIHLRNRREALEYYKARGVDPYDKKQVKEDEERLHRELQEKGTIPPD